tara:strand:+ start:3196 stop:5031 length:1836 start_codon:yes stop_codon:yes gene_type:complete
MKSLKIKSVWIIVLFLIQYSVIGQIIGSKPTVSIKTSIESESPMSNFNKEDVFKFRTLIEANLTAQAGIQLNISIRELVVTEVYYKSKYYSQIIGNNLPAILEKGDFKMGAEIIVKNKSGKWQSFTLPARSISTKPSGGVGYPTEFYEFSKDQKSKFINAFGEMSTDEFTRNISISSITIRGISYNFGADDFFSQVKLQMDEQIGGDARIESLKKDLSEIKGREGTNYEGQLKLLKELNELNPSPQYEEEIRSVEQMILDDKMNEKELEGNNESDSFDDVLKENNNSEKSSRKTQEELYNERIQKQQERNSQLQAASIGASSSFLYVLGGMIYENMGKVPNPKRIYGGNQMYLALNYGYSATSTPILFKSEMTRAQGPPTVLLDDLRTLTINFDFKIKFGYESDNFDAGIFYNFQPGASPVFDAFSFSDNYGLNVAFGTSKIKAFSTVRLGNYNISKTPRSDPEELGSGKIESAFQDLEIGLRYTFWDNSFNRNHLSISLINQSPSSKSLGLISRLTSGADERRMYGFFYDIKNKSEPSRVWEDYVIQGYSFNWTKEHSFEFFIRAFPEFPILGLLDRAYNNGTQDFADRTKAPMMLEIGFVRQFKIFSLK